MTRDSEDPGADALEKTMQDYRSRMESLIEQIRRRQTEFAPAWDQAMRTAQGDLHPTIQWGNSAIREMAAVTDMSHVPWLTTPQQVRYNEESIDDETGEEPHA